MVCTKEIIGKHTVLRVCSTGGAALRYAIILIAVLSANIAKADIVWLTNGNSTAQIETDTSIGISSWTVNGVWHLSQQATWFRVQQVDTEEISVGLLNHSYSNGTNSLSVQYFHNSFNLSVNYLLTGGSTGQGSLTKTISVQNTSSQSITLNLYEYIDWDVDYEFDQTVGSIINGNTAVQTGVNNSVGYSIMSLMPDYYQVGLGFDIIDLLTDQNADNLSNYANALYGDTNFAFQWNILLNPGDVFNLEIANFVVPEPTSLLLLGAGAFALIRRKRG